MHRTLSPDNSDGSIEQAIVAKGLTAPRVTMADIEASIVGAVYFTAQQGVLGASIENGSACCDGTRNPLRLLTFCVLTLSNGFTVTGESACASAENFDADIGRRVAREKAIEKVWPLLGFRLRDKLSADATLEQVQSGLASVIGTIA